MATDQSDEIKPPGLVGISIGAAILGGGTAAMAAWVLREAGFGWHLQGPVVAVLAAWGAVLAAAGRAAVGREHFAIGNMVSIFMGLTVALSRLYAGRSGLESFIVPALAAVPIGWMGKWLGDWNDRRRDSIKRLMRIAVADKKITNPGRREWAYERADEAILMLGTAPFSEKIFDLVNQYISPHSEGPHSQAAVRSLGLMGHPEAQEVLLSVISAAHLLSPIAGEAIGHPRNAAAVPGLRKIALTAYHVGAVETAADALQAIGTPAARTALKDFHDAPRREVSSMHGGFSGEEKVWI